MEDVVCCYCPGLNPNESCDGDLEGWVFTEYGWKCIECVINDPDTSVGSTAGTKAIESLTGK